MCFPHFWKNCCTQYLLFSSLVLKLIYFCLFVFCGARNGTKDLAQAIQTLYHWNPVPKLMGFKFKLDLIFQVSE